MTFGNNALNLTYSANGVAQSFTLTFEALSALKAVPSGEGWQEQVGGDVQVSMAEHWNQNRQVKSPRFELVLCGWTVGLSSWCDVTGRKETATCRTFRFLTSLLSRLTGLTPPLLLESSRLASM